MSRLNPTQAETLAEIERRQRRLFPSVFGLPRMAGVRAYDPRLDESMVPTDPRFRQTMRAGIEDATGSSGLADLAELGVDFAPLAGTMAGIGDTRAAFGQGDIIGGMILGSGTLLGAAIPGVSKLSQGAKRGYDFMRKQGADVDIGDFVSTDKSKLTKFGNRLSTPAVRRREAMRMSSAGTIRPEDFAEGGLGLGQRGTDIELTPIERNIITPSDLQGRMGVPVVGDRSQTGGILTRVGGVPLSRPVLLQGGPLFPFGRRGTGAGWASMSTAATAKQNNLERAAMLSGNFPIGVYSAMTPTSINFSTPPAMAMIAQLDAIGVPKKDLAALNRSVRNYEVVTKDKVTGKQKITQPFKDFVGVDHPDVYDQILGQGGYPKEGAGDLRKAIVETMAADKTGQAKGFPIYRDVMDAVNQPELAGLNRGDAGYSMFEARTNEALRPELDHLSYDTTIPGNVFGGFRAPVPARVMFPRTFEKLDRSLTEAGKPYTEAEKLGSLMMAPHYEPFTQRWVDTVSEYLEKATPYGR